mgnify:CR=1 FL=1
MAVGASYLNKIRYSVRRVTGTDVNAELTDIIEECRLDLISVGVTSAKANDETDSLILGTVRCFARWKFGLSNEDAESNREDYYTLRDELRRRRDYNSYAITFVCKLASTAKADIEVTFNGETKCTDSAGTAVFYYVEAGTNQTYTISGTGYTYQEVDLDVTANATVNVALVVA